MRPMSQKSAEYSQSGAKRYWVTTNGRPELVVELPPGQLPDKYKPLPRPTKQQQAVLKIIRRAPPVLRATKRSVRQRQTFVGARGVAKRRTTIERAMVIIDAAKQTERIHHVPVPGHRRRRWCSAQDVVAWLRKVKNIKFSLKTVRADIRVLKEKTL